MQTQKEWASFKLTLLLYIIVLIIPITFYFISASFDDIQKDTKMIQKIGWISGTAETLGQLPSTQLDIAIVKKVETSLKVISTWVTDNSDSKFYLGGQTLSKDFSDVISCWNTYKQKRNSGITNVNQKCTHTINNFTLIVENMVDLKQKNLVNMFYGSLTLIMLISLLLIYFVRVYIHNQIKKHAIHDYETNLFNKKYFLSELKTSCARSARHNYPLSMLSIFIHNFETAGYDKKTKEHILKVLGGMVTSLTRTSDVACRYDEDQLSILLTDTEEENALFLEGRIREALEKHDFDVSPQLNFKFSTIYFNTQETSETFMSRTQDLLK